MELRNNTEEIKQLREEIKIKEEKWDEEKQKLLKRIDKLEQKMEKCDQDKRKYNIIIKGEGMVENGNRESFKSFLKERLNIEVDVANVHYKANTPQWKTVLVELTNWKQKSEIMQNKRKLKGSKIYIEHDLTLEERRIQKEIRRIGKCEKEKGKKVKISYKKIVVEGINYEWSETEQGVVEVEAGPKNY